MHPFAVVGAFSILWVAVILFAVYWIVRLAIRHERGRN